MPRDPDERNILFRMVLFERMLAELAGELQNRPDWLGIPIHGLLELLAVDASQPIDSVT
jgi:maltose alpha-D-glucosyltransferase/alpha-amylase